MKIILIILFSWSLTNSFCQDIVILKKNGGAMEGYFQELTKDHIKVKFGIYTVQIHRKAVNIIIGPHYEALKSQGYFKQLHEVNTREKNIRRAIRKSKKILRKQLKSP